MIPLTLRNIKKNKSKSNLKINSLVDIRNKVKRKLNKKTI